MRQLRQRRYSGSGQWQWRWHWRPSEKTGGVEAHGGLVVMTGVIRILWVRIELVAGRSMHLRRGQAAVVACPGYGGGVGRRFVPCQGPSMLVRYVG